MSAKKPPCVDIKTDALKDESYEVLAELAGLANRYEAIGRVFALKAWCTDRGLQDAPDDAAGYVVSEAVVRRFLGKNGVAAILGDGVDDFALGERRADGRILLRDTEDIVAAKRQQHGLAKAGGAARAEAARDQGGRFVPPTTNIQPEPQPESSHAPPVEPAGNQPHPASSPSSSPSDLQNTLTPRAIVRPVSWQQRKAWWDCMLAAFDRLIAKGIKPNTPRPAGHPNEQQLVACERFLREGGYDDAGIDAKMRHVVRVNELEAEALGHLEFFKPAIIWDTTRPDRFPRKVDTSAEEAAKRGAARAGPKRRTEGNAIGAATPRSDHPDNPTPVSFSEFNR